MCLYYPRRGGGAAQRRRPSSTTRDATLSRSVERVEGRRASARSRAPSTGGDTLCRRRRPRPGVWRSFRVKTDARGRGRIATSTRRRRAVPLVKTFSLPFVALWYNDTTALRFFLSLARGKMRKIERALFLRGIGTRGRLAIRHPRVREECAWRVCSAACTQRALY